MDDKIITRLFTYLQANDIPHTRFEKEIGLSNGYLKTQLKRNSDLGESVIRKIIDYCLDIDSNWLLTGRGSMLPHKNKPLPIINNEYKGAPYYNVDFIGGFDLVLNDQTINPDYYINFEPYNKPGVVWCNLTGHSMEPELNNGDFIAMKEMTDPIEYLPFGEIYAIVTDNFRTVKRMTSSEKDGFVHLIPTNKSPEFKPQDIPVNMIRKVFAVLGSMHRLF